jgi:hypothetical protein
MIVQCSCRGLKGDSCPRCRGFGTYRVDPDPYRAPGTDGYDVPPRRVVRDGPGSAGVIVWLTCCLAIVAAIAVSALIVIAMSFAAPRSSPDPTAVSSQIGGPTAGAGDPFTAVDGASDRSSSGAPLTQAVSPGPSIPAIGPGRQAGGAPPPSVRGLATWYDAPSLTDAAAGPALRRALGRTWRGSWVRVTHVGDGDARWVVVRLTDWCACGDRNGRPTVIDLDDRAFAELASLGAGVIKVTVERIDGVPEAPTLPPTDEE